MKKGFTLIELLAVIVILAVISLIAVPRIMDAIDDSRKGALSQSEHSMVKAAENFLLENIEKIPEGDNFYKIVDLETLVNLNFLNKADLENCDGYVIVSFVEDINFEYTPFLNCNEVDSSRIQDGLISHYKFEGNFNDEISSNHGTAHNVEFASNRFNNNNSAVRFNGVDSNIRVNGSVVPIQDSFSIVGWLKFTPTNTETRQVWINQYEAVPAEGRAMMGRLFYYEPEDLWHIDLSSGATAWRSINSRVHRNIQIPENEWFNFILTVDNGIIRTYINGMLTGITEQSTTIGDYDLVFGMRADYQEFFEGDIDEVKIYDRPLNIEEINYFANN